MKTKTKTSRAVAPVVAPVIVPALVVTPPRLVPVAGLDSVNDILTTTGHTWNSGSAEVYPEIIIGTESCALSRFEYVATPFPGSKWSILKCSDNGMECGVPFKDSYSVLNNAGLLKIIEVLMAGLELRGLKASIQTSGTLKNRARQFVSVKIEGLDKFQVAGREIHSFLNVLNSIDKSCHVTFANNTFTVCCKNTFAKAMTGEGAALHAMAKHTKGMAATLGDISHMIQAYVTGNEIIAKTLKGWSEIAVGLQDAEEIFAAWLADAQGNISTRTANMIDRLTVLHAKGDGNKGETAFDLFNAVTQYYTHESAGKSDDKNKQFESSENGDAAGAKREFYEYLGKVMMSGNEFKAFCKLGNQVLVKYRTAK